MTAPLAPSFAASIAAAVSAVLMPPPLMTPAEFTREYRVLHSIYCSERPGRWDNTVFPYQDPAMNCVQEALALGKRGVVMMKGGQIGGTDAMLNAMMWLKVYLPGPQLFMSSTDKVASEFGRERFALIIADMEPLRLKYIPNPRGDILVKRFVDGKIQLVGGQSVFNLQSTPYRVVVIDELDSLVDDLGGQGDPVKMAEVRTDAFTGQTLMIAYAHPSTRQRGAGKLYYDQSDQRRGFVKHSCGGEFYYNWEHVRFADELDPDSARYICPNCGSVVTDSERVAMARGLVYRSVLDPEVARKRSWLGIHCSQLYSPAKTLRSLAQRWVECGTDDNAKRVFYNKVLGEPYEPKVSTTDSSLLRKMICVPRRVNDPEHYYRGQVPPGVRFLTAGQDSRTVELHHSIWGWGLRRATDKTPMLCAWLIDWGIVDRPYSLTFDESEYHVYDELIYRRVFPSTVGGKMFSVTQGGHDIGYGPTQIPLVRYCRNWPTRAKPVKGANTNHSNFCKEPYVRPGHALTFERTNNQKVKDLSSESLIMNTYLLKTDWYGWMSEERKIEIEPGRKVFRITFPADVDDEFIKQTASEELVAGDRKGELVWHHNGPNHFADTNIYAFGCAMNLEGFLKNQTADEVPPAPRAQQYQGNQFSTPDGRPYLATER